MLFRDPPSVEREAQARRLAIARALVGAVDLPQPLPKLGLSLIDVEPVGEAIDLVVGTDLPIARARLDPGPRAKGAPFSLGVSIRETQPLAVRYRAATEVMRQRLAKGITEERWNAARAERDALRKLPIGVSLSHFRQIVEGIDPPAGLVRTGFGCNQDCGFCWQSREWPGYGPEQVRTWIEDLRAMGVDELTISGGEPTLDKHLTAHVRHARALGMSRVVIETNAIQIGKRPALAVELHEAGLTRAFVSLHSSDPEISDRVTRAPGTFARTIAGVHALIAAGVHVVLNAVITKESVETLHELPDFVARSFVHSGPQATAPSFGWLTISQPVPPWEGSLAAMIAAPPEAMRAALARTIDAAERAGVRIGGLDGPCGPPLCAFGADPRVTNFIPRQPVSFRTHPPECDRCAVRSSCHGVQPEMLSAFGARAVAPLDRVPTNGSPRGTPPGDPRPAGE